MASKEQQLRTAERRLKRLERELDTAWRRYEFSRSRADQGVLRSVERRLERERAACEKLKQEVEGVPASEEEKTETSEEAEADASDAEQDRES